MSQVSAELSSVADCAEFAFTVRERPPRLLRVTSVVATLLVVATLGWSYLTRAELVVRAAGRVQPLAAKVDVFNPISAATSVTGGGRRVVQVRFSEGERVRRGDVLLHLDTQRLGTEVARLRRARQAGEEELARLGELADRLQERHRAEQSKLERQLAQARTELANERARRDAEKQAAQSEWMTATQSLARVRTLRDDGVASAQELEEAVTRVEQTRARLATAELPVDGHAMEILEQERRALEAAYAFDREELAVKRAARQAELDATKLQLADAELELQQAVIVAPEDGIVTEFRPQLGDLVEPGQVLVTIAPERGFRFDATLPSEDVAELSRGKTARVKLDALDYHDFGAARGEVVYVSPDAGEADAGPEQPAGCYTVRIALRGEQLRRGDKSGRLKLGMSGEAEIVVGRERLLTLFFKKVRQTIRLG